MCARYIRVYLTLKYLLVYLYIVLLSFHWGCSNFQVTVSHIVPVARARAMPLKIFPQGNALWLYMLRLFSPSIQLRLSDLFNDDDSVPYLRTAPPTRTPWNEFSCRSYKLRIYYFGGMRISIIGETQDVVRWNLFVWVFYSAANFSLSITLLLFLGYLFRVRVSF